MKDKFSYAPFERSFNTDFRYGRRSVNFRSGFILRRISEKGVFYCEASPLPGHSVEELSDVAKVLEERPISPLLDNSSNEKETIPSSLRFALEGLIALEAPGKNIVSSNALLTWSEKEATRGHLKELAKAGYRNFKIKISPENMQSFLDLIEENPSFLFRLDANQSLNEKETEKLVNEILKRSLLPRIDYLEEPFAGVWDRKSFFSSPVALAADESAPLPLDAHRLLEAPNPPAAFIIKPTVAGGLFSLEPLLKALSGAGKRFIFTSALETECGRRAILAFLSQGNFEVAGISTGHLFQLNQLEDRPEWNNIPPPNEAELRALSALEWKDCR